MTTEAKIQKVAHNDNSKKTTRKKNSSYLRLCRNFTNKVAVNSSPSELVRTNWGLGLGLGLGLVLGLGLGQGLSKDWG